MTKNTQKLGDSPDSATPVCESACASAPHRGPIGATGDDRAPRVKGRFTKGNRAALRHGARSARVLAGEMPEQQEARAALGERIAAIVADLGGREAISTLALDQIERHARLGLVDAFLWANLQRLGPLTGKGKTRAALTAWLSVVDRLHRSAVTLGLERKQKPANPLDAVRRAVAEANK